MILGPDGTPLSAPAAPHCDCCGTCCRKGGPALHEQDGDLLTEGVLRAQDICTFRTGELVRDEAGGHVMPLPQELVKIAPARGARPDEWACRFLKKNNTCFLYGRHPVECRTLFCRAPEALLNMSGEGRLNRKTVCEKLGVPAWWGELIDTHEEQCSYARLTELAPQMETSEEARRAFLEIVEYDRAFRDLIVEKKAALPEELDFLLGRPLTRTVLMFGMDARVAPGGGISLVQTTRVHPRTV